MAGHGHARVNGKPTITYNSWRAMIARCWHPARRDFKYYGGRGIQVHPRWLCPPRGHGGFAEFLQDVGERPEGTTLDRIDVNGHYEPDNCQWSTVSDQNSGAHRQPNGYYLLDMEDPLEGFEDAADNYKVKPKWPDIVVSEMPAGYTRVAEGTWSSDPDYVWPF